MTLSIIVAMSENGVIGRNGDMPWHLSADLKRFRKLTMGHTIVMGRKTFQSIGRLLPGRKTVIVTRNPDFSVDGALMAGSLDEALRPREGGDIFVVGGGEIYRIALPLVTRMYITRVRTELAGDTTFPAVDWSKWTRVAAEAWKADADNDFDFDFEDWQRRS
jgi:dihydrofolate reductase